MSRNNRFGSLFARSQISTPCGQRSRLVFETLEQRTLLTTLTVDIGDPTANDPGDNLYAQISEAVAAASEGDKIRVHAGTYDPFVVNTDNLTIREARRNSNPVVDGDLNPGDENCIEIDANGVTIKGFTVQNASGSYPETGSGFLVTGDNNTLTGNFANDNAEFGFRLYASIGNTLKGNAAHGHGFGGFYFENSDDNTLTANTASGYDFFGFGLEHSHNNTLTGNTASGNGDAGFHLYRSHNTTLKGNTASGNDYSGFYFGYSDDNTLAANTARDNGGDGFYLSRSDDNTLLKNWAFHNIGNGFALVDYSDNNMLTKNWSMFNEGNGFALVEGSDNNTRVAPTVGRL